MKIIFLLDDDSTLAVAPEQLQLRQIQPDLAALVIPAGQNEEGEDLFRPLVTYPVVLSAVPAKAEPINAGEATPVQKPQLVGKKKSKKASAK